MDSACECRAWRYLDLFDCVERAAKHTYCMDCAECAESAKCAECNSTHNKISLTQKVQECVRRARGGVQVGKNGCADAQMCGCVDVSTDQSANPGNHQREGAQNCKSPEMSDAREQHMQERGRTCDSGSIQARERARALVSSESRDHEIEKTWVSAEVPQLTRWREWEIV